MPEPPLGLGETRLQLSRRGLLIVRCPILEYDSPFCTSKAKQVYMCFRSCMAKLWASYTEGRAPPIFSSVQDNLSRPQSFPPNQVRKSDRLANATDEERKEEERRKITSLTNSPE